MFPTTRTKRCWMHKTANVLNLNPKLIRASRILSQPQASIRRTSITSFSGAYDGSACFHGVTAAGCSHEKIVIDSVRASMQRPEFRWVNTVLGNIKTALRGTYHGIRPKYAQRQLSEFECRFKCRFELPGIIPRFSYVAFRTPPMPERLLKLNLA